MDLSYGANQNNPQINSSTVHFGKSKPLNFTIGARTHQCFGGLCIAPDDTMYVVFRAAYLHLVLTSGSAYDGIGGDIYYSKSNDYGNTWATPILVLAAPAGRDYRDATLTYDDLWGVFFFVYTDVSTDYANGTNVMHIMRSTVPFTSMTEVTPTLPFALKTQTFHTVERNGSYVYLPYYGNNGAGEPFSNGILRCGDSYAFNVIKSWSKDGNTEAGLFFTNQANGAVRINVLFRAESDLATITYSDDAGVTWSAKRTLGFQAAGGGRVFQINDIYLLVARDQSLGTNLHSYTFAMWSKDGINWRKRERIGNAGPGYPTFARTNNGRCFLAYSEESGTSARMFIKEILNVPGSADLA